MLESHTLVGSFYSFRNNLTAVLMLNNKGGLPLAVTPTFYSSGGTQLQLAPIIVREASYAEFDVREMLANAGAEFQEGNLQMTYQGKRLQLGSQIKVIDEGKSLIWEEQFVEPTAKYESSRLEGVWWMPSNNCDTEFIITNTTDAPVTATIAVDGTSPNQQSPVTIQLTAHETRVLDVMRDLVRKNNGTIHTTGGVSISHTGEPGAVMARMLISKANKGFSSTMNFIDPEKTASSKWHGAGLHLGKINNQKLQQILVARNVGNQTTTVSGKVQYTNNNGEVVSIAIPPTNIAPNASKKINLQTSIDAANVPSNVKYGGLEMSYTTAKGSVVMSAVSISQDDNQVFQVPLYDPNKTSSSAGGYPWKTDGDYTTVVYLKNETDQPKKYTINLVYEGGEYTLGVREIKARETAAIDFREMRDAETPDVAGNIIPLNTGTGQIGWSVKGNDNHTLNGRSEQISLANGISSTYDCRNCCPNSYLDSFITPLEVTAEVGDTTDFDAFFFEGNCYGQNYTTPIPADFVIWESVDPDVASCNYNNGIATGISPGNTTIQARWTAETWFDDGGERCDLIPIEVLEEAFCDVRPPPTVQIAGFNNVPLDSSGIAGVTKSIQQTATGMPSGGTYSWSTNSNKITLSNISSSTVTVESASASVNMNDIVITVNYTVNGRTVSTSKFLTVVKPTVIRKLNQTTDPMGTNCGTYNAFLTRITYDTLDQFSQPILGVNVYADETFDLSDINGNCLLGNLQQGGGLHSSTTIIDTFRYCNDACNDGFSCVISGLRQSLTVNGFPVQIEAGGNNFSRNLITYTCSNVIVIPTNN